MHDFREVWVMCTLRSVGYVYVKECGLCTVLYVGEAVCTDADLLIFKLCFYMTSLFTVLHHH